MLDNNTRTVLSAALELSESQQFQLIDALLDRGEEPEDLHAEAPPLTDNRLQELVREGKDAIAQGDSKSFQTPKALADHVGEIFDQTILDSAKVDSQE